MTTRLLLVGAALLGQLAGSGVDFSVDWAAFGGQGDSSRVEVFYAIPYVQKEGLDFVVADDTSLVAEFSVRFELENGIGFRQDATIFKQVTITSHVEAQQTQRTFVDGFSVTAPPGKYSLRMTIAKPAAVQPDRTGDSLTFVPSGVYEDSIEIPDFTASLVTSSLQLAAGVMFDTLAGGFSVIPNPTRSYGAAGLETVYFYIEGYNFTPESDSFEVNATILSSDAESGGLDTLLQALPRAKPKRGRAVATTLGIGVADLDPGEYRLRVELGDLGSGERAGAEAVFAVSEPEDFVGAAPYRLDMNERERRYHRELEYIATPRELAYFNALSDSGKEAYLAWFWSRHNLAEFARRVETAEARFTVPTTAGLKTDRGRVYVKYGEPDEVERMTLEVDRRPREYWHYYSLGYVFVFVDLRGDSNYRLVYANSPDESGTGLEKYLTPDEEELFRP